MCTVCPRSSDPFYIGSYYIKGVTTSWTDSNSTDVKQNYCTCHQNAAIKLVSLALYDRSLVVDRNVLYLHILVYIIVGWVGLFLFHYFNKLMKMLGLGGVMI